jgi:hypothetical protein
VFYNWTDDGFVDERRTKPYEFIEKFVDERRTKKYEFIEKVINFISRRNQNDIT